MHNYHQLCPLVRAQLNIVYSEKESVMVTVESSSTQVVETGSVVYYPPYTGPESWETALERAERQARVTAGADSALGALFAKPAPETALERVETGPELAFMVAPSTPETPLGARNRAGAGQPALHIQRAIKLGFVLPRVGSIKWYWFMCVGQYPNSTINQLVAHTGRVCRAAGVPYVGKGENWRPGAPPQPFTKENFTAEMAACGVVVPPVAGRKRHCVKTMPVVFTEKGKALWAAEKAQYAEMWGRLVAKVAETQKANA